MAGGGPRLCTRPIVAAPAEQPQALPSGHQLGMSKEPGHEPSKRESMSSVGELNGYER